MDWGTPAAPINVQILRRHRTQFRRTSKPKVTHLTAPKMSPQKIHPMHDARHENISLMENATELQE